MNTARRYGFEYADEAVIDAPAQEVFPVVDDPELLSSHMAKPSWRMAWGTMATSTDAGRGREVGSVIKLAGSMLGMRLDVREAVVERIPFKRKVWETMGQAKLLILDSYRMGFDIQDMGPTCRLRIFISYNLPRGGIGFWLGKLAGRFYAAWCVRTMVSDVQRHVGKSRQRQCHPCT